MLNTCDVLVAGGGPSGSTISALLAERGLDVVMVEKDHHPRFHIGESLLPQNLPLLERLGLLEDIKRIGLFKPGAEFTSPWHNKTVTFDFSEALDNSVSNAYQVRRSEFDEILFRHAAKKGAKTKEGCKVTQVNFQPDGSSLIAIKEEGGEEANWHARFFVDASGRDTLLGNKFAIKHKNPKHNSAALYGHFTGARRNTGTAEGNISIFWFDHGWFWFIPLADGVTSIGAVCWPYYLKTRKTDPSQFLLETIALCPPLAERLTQAKLTGPATATGNYSYRSERMSGKGYVMLGDAYAFIDPIFSAGVLVAMQSAFLGADVVESALREPARAPRLMRNFDSTIRGGLKTFSWFIYRATQPSLRDMFMEPRNYFRMRQAVMSVLAGDVWGNTPVRRYLPAFKLMYYLFNTRELKRTFAAWRRRKMIVQDASVSAKPEKASATT